MKNVYILLISTIVAFLLIPIGKINAQIIPNWSGFKAGRIPISSTNVLPNASVY